jgi:prepilin-type N-terminal cleavage/methylation domain-containing protein
MMYRSAVIRSTWRAFTLIELLVVVSIIALLISILLPSLSAAREKAKSAMCISNQGSCARAQLTYITEYDQAAIAAKWAPHYDMDQNPIHPLFLADNYKSFTSCINSIGGLAHDRNLNPTPPWCKMLNRYILKDVSKTGEYAGKMARCPSDTGFVETPVHIFSTDNHPDFDNIYSGQSWFWMAGTSFFGNYTTLRGGSGGLGYTKTANFYELGMKMKTQEVFERNASEAIMYREARMDQLTWECWFARTSEGLPGYKLRGWHKQMMEANCSFMDGHAETVNCEPDVQMNPEGEQLNPNGWPDRNRRWSEICGFIRWWHRGGGGLVGWSYFDENDPWYHRPVRFAWYNPVGECE